MTGGLKGTVMANTGCRALGFAVVAGLAFGTAAAAETSFVSVGTGAMSGLYYPVGRALCDLVNQGRRQHGVRCSAEPTVGSVFNMNQLRAGELDLALVQSDVQYAAYEGRGPWQGAPYVGLRSVLSLYPELVTILVRRDAQIGDVEALKGKRVDIGRPGSGARATWDVIEAALGWARADLKLAAELKPDSAGDALCANEVDASVQLVGHSSAWLAQWLDRCDLALVGVAGPAVAGLVSGRPYYRPGEIPAGMYGGNAATPTFGVSATLVTSAELPDEVVHAIARAAIKGVDQLRTRRPALARLEPEEMVRASLTAPLHPGAERAYRELGLIK
jgi:TRAP transporter TAXI family solute receptor